MRYAQLYFSEQNKGLVPLHHASGTSPFCLSDYEI